MAEAACKEFTVFTFRTHAILAADFLGNLFLKEAREVLLVVGIHGIDIAELEQRETVPGLETGTDVSGNYKLLAKIYHTEGSLDKLSSLREKAQGLDSIMKTTILQALEEISQSETGSRQ